MSFKGTRQDSEEPLQEATATTPAEESVYEQQWQRRRQAVLQEENALEASTKAESVRGNIQAKDGPKRDIWWRECW